MLVQDWSILVHDDQLYHMSDKHPHWGNWWPYAQVPYSSNTVTRRCILQQHVYKTKLPNGYQDRVITMKYKHASIQQWRNTNLFEYKLIKNKYISLPRKTAVVTDCIIRTFPSKMARLLAIITITVLTENKEINR